MAVDLGDGGVAVGPPDGHGESPALRAQLTFGDLVAGALDAVLVMVEGRVIYAEAAAAKIGPGKVAAGWERVLASSPELARLAPHSPARFVLALRRADGCTAEAARVARDGIAAVRRAEPAPMQRTAGDCLTRLPGQVRLDQALRQRLAEAAAEGSMVAVLKLGLDRFGEVDDRHGHGAGDLVLAMVAERLLQALRRSDLVARPHGDGFVIVTGGHRELSIIAAIAQRVMDILAAPLAIGGREFRVRASLGLAVSPDDALLAARLLARADAALQAAKAAGGGCWRRAAPARLTAE